jgi:hypothetical protein
MLNKSCIYLYKVAVFEPPDTEIAPQVAFQFIILGSEFFKELVIPESMDVDLRDSVLISTLDANEDMA